MPDILMSEGWPQRASLQAFLGFQLPQGASQHSCLMPFPHHSPLKGF